MTDVRRRAAPRLIGVGTALPEQRHAQEDLCTEIESLLDLNGSERSRWERIWRGSGIAWRHAVSDVGSILELGTAARMLRFDEQAPALAANAAKRALTSAGIAADAVTDLVVVTCTGFSAPGVPRRLHQELGLRASVRTSQVGFMGCFGGVCGLRTAAAHALAADDAVVLLVCVELCSLHLRNDRDPQNLVACALFADGAAAAVIAAPHSELARARSKAPAIRPGRSLTVEGTIDAMSWVITDAGFAMTLSRDVPRALGRELPNLVGSAGDVLVHPGGPAVVDAIEEALAPHQRGAIDIARTVLFDCGNMSSATILFVLERWLGNGGCAPATLVAFGPGVTIDLVELESSEATSAAVVPAPLS